MLKCEDTVLVLIDIQPTLAGVMHAKETLVENVKKAVAGMQALEIPIVCTEQNPDRLGPTIPEVAGLMPGVASIPKLSFSCWHNDDFVHALKATGRRQVLIAGIEAHVCVYQTAADLIEAGYEVQVLTDAVDSRTQENRQLALQRMRDCGVTVTGTEMALFELLEVAQGDRFKHILKIVK